MAKSDLFTQFGDRTMPVLGNGHIRLVDALGDDDAIVQAARVAYGKGTKSVSDDRTLIRYLMRHRHTTPFEMCMLKLHIRAPMDVWRQWIRHRTAHVNEYSTRYSEAIDDRLVTESDRWRLQDKSNKQGSGGSFVAKDVGHALSTEENWLHEQSMSVYRRRLEHGVAREQARKDLPLSTYTEAYWMIDLHNLFHFLGLRADSHAQHEIRQYAALIMQMTSVWVPSAYSAWLDYRHNSWSLSDSLVRIVHDWNTLNKDTALERIWSEACIQGWIKPVPGKWGEFTYPRNRERDEVEASLFGLGLPIFWRRPYAETG